MMSHTRLQIITIHILANIASSKGNKIMKFGQLINHSVINTLLQKSCIKWGKETSSRPLVNKLHNISDCWFRDIPNINFLQNGVWLASPPHFSLGFLRKTFPMLYSISLPNFIVCLCLLLEILGNMCIVIVCCSAYDVINFETNNSFLVKLLSRIIRTYLRNEKSFEIKSIFIIFKGH